MARLTIATQQRQSARPVRRHKTSMTSTMPACGGRRSGCLRHVSAVQRRANQAVNNYLENGWQAVLRCEPLRAGERLAGDGRWRIDARQRPIRAAVAGPCKAQGQSLQENVNTWDTRYKVASVTACSRARVWRSVLPLPPRLSGCAGLVRAGAAGLGQPWPLSESPAWTAIGIAIPVSQVVVTGGLIAGAVYGTYTVGKDISQNVSAGNWNAVAFDAGTVVGGSLVGIGGGGRAMVDGMGLEPSPAPNMTLKNLFSD